MFDAQDARFRSIKLRPKQAGCVVCGENPSVTQLVDYESFCGSAATDKVGPRRQKEVPALIIRSHMFFQKLCFLKSCHLSWHLNYMSA